MRFTKMQGIGNDYVFVDCTRERVDDPAHVARAISDRHFGVGADGLVLIMPSDEADVGMRMFNADGSEAEMCGNAIRCLARYAYEHGICRKEEMVVQTKAGPRPVRLIMRDGRVTGATVNMGRPRLRRSEIPMAGPDSERVINEDLTVGDAVLRVTCVSMGNPHCIVPVESLGAYDWRELGPRIERHPAFPERTNVHFVETLSPSEVRMIPWERGSGATLGCGTGASAVCVAMHLLGHTGRALLAHLPGGDLELEWSERDDCVYMTGAAVEVFTGDWPT